MAAEPSADFSHIFPFVEGLLTEVTTEKLGATVGALIVGADCDRLLNDDAFPAWCLDALEANGALVFRDLHIDDGPPRQPAEIPFSFGDR